MGSSNQKILRVQADLEEIKRSYNVLSRYYAIIEGIFEKRLRQKGLEFLSVASGEVVLEIGIGAGYSLKEIAESVGQNGKIFGIDISPQMLKITRKRLEKVDFMDRVELYEGDARNMPFEDSKFDAVYTASTLELFDTPDIPKVLNEIKRVLKVKGRLVVASLNRKGRENSLFIKIYEWLHQKIPNYANCRPIYVERSVEEAGYQITRSEDLILYRMVPWKIVAARPKVDL
jgi:ubiquinone/menaquinone biosynthesis C-methylase UbiE